MKDQSIHFARLQAAEAEIRATKHALKVFKGRNYRFPDGSLFSVRYARKRLAILRAILPRLRQNVERARMEYTLSITGGI